MNNKWDCKCQDSANNTYFCIRKLTDTENSIRCQFQDNEDFIEVYDLNEDPYQLNNLIFSDGGRNGLTQDQIRKELGTAKQPITKLQVDFEQDNFSWISDMIRKNFKSFWNHLSLLLPLW